MKNKSVNCNPAGKTRHSLVNMPKKKIHYFWMWRVYHLVAGGDFVSCQKIIMFPFLGRCLDSCLLTRCGHNDPMEAKGWYLNRRTGMEFKWKKWFDLPEFGCGLMTVGGADGTVEPFAIRMDFGRSVKGENLISFWNPKHKKQKKRIGTLNLLW